MERVEQALCVAGGSGNGAAATENGTVALQNIKNKVSAQSSDPTSGYMPQRTESRDANRYLCVYVHSDITHNSQKVEATQVSTNRWLGEQTCHLH